MSKFYYNYELKVSRISEESKYKKHKENHIRIYNYQFSQNQGKMENF